MLLLQRETESSFEVFCLAQASEFQKKGNCQRPVLCNDQRVPSSSKQCHNRDTCDMMHLPLEEAQDHTTVDGMATAATAPSTGRAISNPDDSVA